MNEALRQVIFSGIVSVRDRLLKLDNPLRLESGEPSFDTPEHIKEAVIRAIHDNQTHYAPSTGIGPLRKALLKKVVEKNGLGYLNDIGQIMVTSGGMHALYVAFQTILSEGDEVIIPQPNWPATGWVIRLSGGKTVGVPLKPELDYRWDPDELRSAITNKTKAILINSPHNPTGGVMKKDDLSLLLELAEEHSLYLIADEAYEDIIYEGKHVALGSLAYEFPKAVQDRIISCFTFSKSYAMTGWRLGYLVCSSDEFETNAKKMILYSINGVSTPVQYGGLAAVEGDQACVVQMCQAYRQRRDMLFEGLKQTDLLKCEASPHGSFYLYASLTDSWPGSAPELVNHLIDSFSLGSVPGDLFGDEHRSIRFSYACSTEMISQAIENLASAKRMVTDH